MHSADLIGSAPLYKVDFDWIVQIIKSPPPGLCTPFTFNETRIHITISQKMGLSPKILAVLIALGLVATGSIIFNVYFLATKDKALESIRDEVEA